MREKNAKKTKKEETSMIGQLILFVHGKLTPTIEQQTLPLLRDHKKIEMQSQEEINLNDSSKMSTNYKLSHIILLLLTFMTSALELVSCQQSRQAHNNNNIFFNYNKPANLVHRFNPIQQDQQQIHHQIKQPILIPKKSQPYFLASNKQQAQNVADRRTSSSQQQPQQLHQHHSGKPHFQSDQGGKLLVCYYTTRQAAHFWPRDAREFVIPPDGLLNSAEFMSHATQFGPILPYEPFVQPQKQTLDAQSKNQQQQLVFKSAAMQQNGGFVADGFKLVRNDNGKAPSGKQTVNKQFATAANERLIANKNKTPAYNLVDGPLQLASFEHVGNSLVGGGSFGNSPVFSSQAPPPTTATASVGLPINEHQNNNGAKNNNFIGTGKDQANNGLNHPERMVMLKQQQLVFSPPPPPMPSTLSRAFIVGGGESAASSVATSNNEILDTKSQLFISTPLNNFNQQASPSTTTSTTATPSSSLNQHQQFRGKSLQFPASGEQLSAPQNYHHQQHPSTFISGAVSNVPPVPLSSASSLLNHQAASSAGQAYRGLQNSQQATSQLSLFPTGNQIIFPASQKSAPSNFIQMGDNSNLASSRLNSISQDSSAAASSTSAVLADIVPLGQQPVAGSNQNSGSGATTAAVSLVSSPLSSVFDVFGAASQYLMKFKPSSLLTPAAFAFNTIQPAGDHQQQHTRQQQHQLNKLSNSSAAATLPGMSVATSDSQSATNSSAVMISLPFSSSFMTNIKSPTNDRSSSATVPATGIIGGSTSSGISASGGGSGILSRFSLNQANPQRREEVCGRTIQTPQRRIIGGEGARYGEFPYQVHIKIAKHQCGGALVDKQSIVTAAHCVYHFITRAPPNKLQIVIGAYDIEDEQYQELPPQYFKVKQVKLHPNFRFSASHPDRYDIAILKLDKPVKYTDNVLPVCLPPAHSSTGGKDMKFENMIGTVTGFGKTDPSLSNRYGTRLLQKVDVPIIENNECERWHRTRGIDLKIFPEMMCAGYEDGLKDACVGDSGGPLVVKTATGPNGAFRWTLAGITSAGFGCAQSRQPGIYHRVSHTVDWILENLD